MDIEDVSSFNSNDQRLRNFDQNKFKLFFDEVIANSPKDEKNLQDLIGKLRRKYKINPKKSVMLHFYRKLYDDIDPKLELLLTNKLAKIHSGVEVVTLFTSPNPKYTNKEGKVVTQKFSCGKNCGFCPKELEVNIRCLVKSITFNKWIYEIDLESFDAIDEVRVITYILVNGEKLYCRDFKNFDDEKRTFTVCMIEKYANKLLVNMEVTCTKVEQSRSYISTEPGVRRANQSNYDCVMQFFDRASALEACGHKVDKLEILVLGGTWSHYPVQYQEEFVRDTYYAANIFYSRKERDRLSLEEEISTNQDSKCRIIGLTLETRPDCINMKEINRFRRYNCTRVQIGVQHIDDNILKTIERGCYKKDTIKALKLLKKNCYKVDYHLMPDLPGSSLEIDRKMFNKILNCFSSKKIYLDKFELTILIIALPFILINKYLILLLLIYLFYKNKTSNFIIYKLEGNELQADQWKIYPTMVTRWTKIYDMFHNGEYISYAEDIEENGRSKITNLLLDVKRKVFPWIRLNRVIRDIPEAELYGGNMVTNLRQHLADIMKKENNYCKCIRCREVKSREINKKNIKKVIRKYNDNEGDEYFISFESKDESIIYGFCRLRINHNNDDVLDTIKDHALVRELHVYGVMIRHDSKDKKTQHIGLGKKLLKEAEYISMLNGYNKIAIISGVGVREYYSKQGYYLKDNFMLKYLSIY